MLIVPRRMFHAGVALSLLSSTSYPRTGGLLVLPMVAPNAKVFCTWLLHNVSGHGMVTDKHLPFP